MTDYKKPLPAPDVVTQPYWDGTKAHELRAQRCSNCGRFRWPPEVLCPHCYSHDFSWVALAETGTVESYVVVHQATAQAFADDVPYVVVKVAIDGTDGRVSLTSNLLEVPWEEVQVGMRVTVTFDDVTPEVTLPKFILST